MKPHPRIRKTIKWGGLALTVLLVVVWIGGSRYQPGVCVRQGAAVSLVFGGIEIYWDNFFQNGIEADLFERRRAILAAGRGHWLWVTGAWQVWSDSGIVRVPLWPIAAISLLVGSMAWRLDTLARRRARLNLCPKCNYDRTGLASKDAKCPECGAVPAGV